MCLVLNFLFKLFKTYPDPDPFVSFYAEKVLFKGQNFMGSSQVPWGVHSCQSGSQTIWSGSRLYRWDDNPWQFFITLKYQSKCISQEADASSQENTFFCFDMKRQITL